MGDRFTIRQQILGAANTCFVTAGMLVVWGTEHVENNYYKAAASFAVAGFGLIFQNEIMFF